MKADEEEQDAKYKKHREQRSQRHQGLAVLILGFSVGFIVAERFYLYRNLSEGKLPPWYANTTNGVAKESGQRVRMTSRTNLDIKQRKSSAHDSSDLLDFLKTVAPDKEIMIAISDYNLVREGMVLTWVSVN